MKVTVVDTVASAIKCLMKVTLVDTVASAIKVN